MIVARRLLLALFGLLLPMAAAQATSAVHATAGRHVARPAHVVAKAKPAHVHVVKATKVTHRKPRVMPAA